MPHTRLAPWAATALLACTPPKASTDPPADTARTDADADGVFVPEDCDDADPDVRPGVAETCNGRDDDCDGDVDEDAIDAPVWYLDPDGDGVGDASQAVVSCSPPATGVSTSGDCDETRPEVHPGAPEVCDNGLDDDCSGIADDLDADADGHIDAACGGADCDDALAEVHPGRDEVCDNGLDDDCDPSTHCRPTGDLDLDSTGTHWTRSEADRSFGVHLDLCHDLTGDGLPDLLAGDPGPDSEPGAAWIIPGGAPGGAVEAIGLPLHGTEVRDKAGVSVACRGDADDDGYGDVAIGAYYRTTDGGSKAGETYVVAGPITGAMNLADADFTVQGMTTGDSVGAESWLGDVVGGDGVADLLTTGWAATGRGLSEDPSTVVGAIYLFAGPLSLGSDAVAADSAELTVYGGSPGTRGFHRKDVTIGDITGDGLPELVASQEEWTAGGAQGRVWVLQGEDLDPATTGGVLDLALSPGLSLTGGPDDTSLGASVQLSDLDGDGLADLTLTQLEPTGMLRAFSGTTLQAALSMGELDLALDAHFARVDRGDWANAGTRHDTRGDLDGDGWHDLVLPGDRASDVATDAGAMWVLHGPLTGHLSLEADASFRVTSTTAGSRLGSDVASGVDVDGDGRHDILVGAPFLGLGGQVTLVSGAGQ